MSTTETKWRYLRAIVPLLQLGVIGKTWEPFVGQQGKSQQLSDGTDLMKNGTI